MFNILNYQSQASRYQNASLFDFLMIKKFTRVRMRAEMNMVKSIKKQY